MLTSRSFVLHAMTQYAEDLGADVHYVASMSQHVSVQFVYAPNMLLRMQTTNSFLTLIGMRSCQHVSEN